MNAQRNVARRFAARIGALVLGSLLALGGVVGPWAVAPVAGVSGIDVQLPAGHHITGHAFGPGHVALAGVDVTASGSQLASPSAITTADGSYTLHGVPDGTYQVDFHAPEGSNLLGRWYGAPGSSQNSTGAQNVVVAGADVPGIDAQLETGRTISGTVAGDGTDPVGGIQVNANGQSGAGAASTAADGSFSIKGLYPATYGLTIDTPLNSPYEAGTVRSGAIVQGTLVAGTMVDVSTTDAAGVDFSVAIGVSISGHIDGGDGPVEVYVSGSIALHGSGQAASSAAGDYTVRGLWPDTYSVVYGPAFNDALHSSFPYGAYANGQLVDQGSPVPVDATAGSIVLDSITIPVGASLSGRVTGDGAGLAGAYVQMCDLADFLGCATTATTPDGSYSFNHVETGAWIILAAPEHHVAGYFGPGGFAGTAALATPVHVDAGGPDATGIDISSPDGGAISGIVTGPGATALSGVSISFGGAGFPGQAPCVSGSGGAYLCDGVAAGIYQVYLAAPATSDELSGYYFAGGPGNYTSNGLDATEIKVTDTNDSVPPTIISRSPDRTVHGVVRDTSVAVGFSEDVIGIGPRTFQLELDGTTTVLTGKYTYDGSTHVAIFKPSSLLAPGKRYRVVVAAGLVDDAGNHFVRSSWTFTVNPDATPPTVVGRVPRPGTTDMPDGESIRVQFSEQVRGISASTFLVVRRSDQRHLIGTIVYDAATRTAFLGSEGLDPSTAYLVVLEPGITDLAGNPLARISWTFSTSP